MAMVFIGVIILAASAAMFWWAAPQGSADTVSAQNPLPIINDEPVDRSGGAEPGGKATVADRRLPDAEEPALQSAIEAQAASRAATGERRSAAIQPKLPTEADKASILARPSSSDDSAPVVAVAETAEELLALEAIQQREVEADLAEPSAETTAAVPPVSKVAAKATAWVNLRAGPSDDAEVLMVVPALADIEAEAACNWCAVSYDGREGFIYKTFISYE
jgi:acetylornithine deacetylase/succinyl-diaminopimelate desuccinylase-like protein